jgi:hypothetical protein
MNYLKALSGFDQSQRQAAAPPLRDGQCNPDLKQRVDENLLIPPNVDGSKSDPFDDGLGDDAVRFRAPW